MKVAVPVFHSRISPVFDVAHLCLLVELRDGTEADRQQLVLRGKIPHERVDELRKQGVNLLICGGITGVTRVLAENAGVRVLSGVAGDVEKVLEAFRERDLDKPRFRMPGCRRRRRRIGRGRERRR